jgi:hypothetical protein
MPRTVAALYSTRAEAETAQARLQAELETISVTINSQYDGEGLSKHGFSDADLAYYQEALSRGDYLLSAKVAAGEDPERVVQVLKESASTNPADHSARSAGPAVSSLSSDGAASRQASDSLLFVGEAWIARGDARVTYSAPPASGEALSRSAYTPPGTRRFTDEEIRAAGLLQERSIEASAMGEVPVIRKQQAVREEVVIRKAAEERTEIIRETVRRTATDVERLGSGTKQD